MALWNALRPLLLKEIVLLGMKQMFNISGFSRLSRLVSLQTCTCPSPQVSQGCSHLFFSLILGVIIWKKTPKNPGKCGAGINCSFSFILWFFANTADKDSILPQVLLK